jgi:hypothetical protein
MLVRHVYLAHLLEGRECDGECNKRETDVPVGGRSGRGMTDNCRENHSRSGGLWDVKAQTDGAPRNLEAAARRALDFPSSMDQPDEATLAL